MRKPMTLRVYEAVCPDDIIADDDPRRKAIIDEMRVVLFGTVEQAKSKIAWWGMTPQGISGFIRKARRHHAILKREGV